MRFITTGNFTKIKTIQQHEQEKKEIELFFHISEF